ncbi:cytochrome C oxidase subunit IV family protein [Marinicella gelatinilytica]|uniref:cytochrome C oxidase subunit IV family protein n=1 Tax=Marinicella gelatinilytica TaxID=2996017 RepID=UPI002260B1E7|nr:cytochrome C oxidase subunit IV family protein [Marinicella gelatinilytica]MCX7545500.1 cytochrome C oxidase subunit IV family protein [Marinicella gelatinilytica]
MNKIYNIHTVWLMLVLLTLLTYGLSYIDANDTVIMLILMVVALTKGVMIIRDYMELKGVSLLWKIIMYGWITVVSLAIVVAYLLV